MWVCLPKKMPKRTVNRSITAMFIAELRMEKFNYFYVLHAFTLRFNEYVENVLCLH